MELIHPHSYAATPSFEALSETALLGYLDRIPSSDVGALGERYAILRELARHPTISAQHRARYQGDCVALDEQVYAQRQKTARNPIGDVNLQLSHVVLPRSYAPRDPSAIRETYRRAGALLDECEQGLAHQNEFVPAAAIGVAAELLVNLAFNGTPALPREDGCVTMIDGKKTSWDTSVQSKVRLPSGIEISRKYAIQVKCGDRRGKYTGRDLKGNQISCRAKFGDPQALYGDYQDSLGDPRNPYHQNIVVLLVNPSGNLGDGSKFLDFVRLAIPGTPSKQCEIDRYKKATAKLWARVLRHPRSFQKTTGCTYQ